MGWSGVERSFHPPLNPRPSGTRIINGLSSPLTAGFYTKAPSKPNNHSRFTGKCGRPRCLGCHTQPVCKSRDKAKGCNKLRSSDVATDLRLIAWRIVDGGEGRQKRYAGASATAFLTHLTGYHEDDMDDAISSDDDGNGDDDIAIQLQDQEGIEEVGQSLVEMEMEDDDVGFFAVECIWEIRDVEEEDWCLLGYV